MAVKSKVGTAQTFTAAQTFRAANAVRSEAAATQDAIVLAGRAGGTSSFAATFTPTTLSANRTITIPDATTTMVGTDVSQTLSNKILLPSAGTATAGTAPLKFATGVNLTAAEAGAIEYDGTYLYATENTTSGRGHVPTLQTFRLTSNGGNVGPTIGDFFGATSSINLSATSVYEILYHVYTQKNTAGTITWTLTASSAPTLIHGYYYSSPLTGIAAGTATTAFTGSAGATTAAFAATASVGNNTNLVFVIRAYVVTNLATTFKLQATCGAGSVTPFAGSFYKVERMSTSVGSFA